MCVGAGLQALGAERCVSPDTQLPGEEKKGLGVKFLRPQGRERERVPGAGFPERRSRGAEERKGGRKGFFPDTPGRDGAEFASAGKSGETVQSPRGKV